MKYLLFALFGTLYLAGTPRFTRVSDIETAIAASSNKTIAKGEIGIDISEYNKIDWLKMYQSNERIRFIYIRATCGTVQDKMVLEHINKIKGYRLNQRSDIGLYHFYKFSQSVPNQVKAFMAVWNKNKNLIQMPPVIDVEYNPPVKDDLFLPERIKNEKLDLIAFIQQVALETKKEPIIYTNKEYYERWIAPIPVLAKYPIWLAHYDDIEDILSNAQSGKYKFIKNPIALIQYSNKGRIDASKYDIDLNIKFK